MFLNQLSIAKRLACVLGLILSLSLLTSLFAVFKLRQMGEVTDAMLAVNLKTERAAADLGFSATQAVALQQVAYDELSATPHRPALQAFLTEWSRHLWGLRAPRELRWHLDVDPAEV